MRTGTEQAKAGSYREVLADRVFLRFLVVVFASAFVGYGMIEAGFTAYARTVADASTRTIGLAFAANTATIVALQLYVTNRTEGRRRTRLLASLAGLWAASYVVLGVAGLSPGSRLAAVLVMTSAAVFAVGETMLSGTVPALTNALATERLRGRYNAMASLSFQLAAIAAPVMAGFVLGADLPEVFIGVVILGCLGFAALALQIERHLPPEANGVRVAALAAADGRPALTPPLPAAAQVSDPVSPRS